jgi:hypothetical protein
MNTAYPIGNSLYGGSNNSIYDLTDIKSIYNTSGAYFILNTNNEGFTIGNSNYGNIYNTKLSDIKEVYGNENKFLVINSNTIINVDISYNNVVNVVFSNNYFGIITNTSNLVSIINNYTDLYEMYKYLKSIPSAKKELLKQDLSGTELYIPYSTISTINNIVPQTTVDFKVKLPSNKEITLSIDDLNFIIPIEEYENILITNNNYQLTNINNKIYLNINGSYEEINDIIINDIKYSLYNGSIIGFGNQESNLPCFTINTKVLTPYGYIPIDKLKVNDTILTSDNRIVNIKNIYRFTVEGNNYTYPYIIPKNTINNNSSFTISPNHLIQFKNNFWFKPIKGLFNKKFKQDKSKKYITYFQLVLPNYFTDFIVINNGIITESYADNINVKYQFNRKSKLYKIKQKL